jgi:Uma2 family endonuclease
MPATTLKAGPSQSFLLHGISWKVYDALVNELAEEHIFMTYDRGELEFMSPLPKHEYYKNVFHDWIRVLGEEWGMDVRSGGNTTFRRKDLERGLEPDDCFWIAKAAAIRGKIDLDLSVDPPPDLAVEHLRCLGCAGIMAVRWPDFARLCAGAGREIPAQRQELELPKVAT